MRLAWEEIGGVGNGAGAELQNSAPELVLEFRAVWILCEGEILLCYTGVSVEPLHGL